MKHPPSGCWGTRARCRLEGFLPSCKHKQAPRMGMDCSRVVTLSVPETQFWASPNTTLCRSAVTSNSTRSSTEACHCDKKHYTSSYPAPNPVTTSYPAHNPVTADRPQPIAAPGPCPSSHTASHSLPVHLFVLFVHSLKLSPQPVGLCLSQLLSALQLIYNPASKRMKAQTKKMSSIITEFRRSCVQFLIRTGY